MAPLSENPFAALTTVVAPAILTNASSVLCLGTANRLARVVDRTRAVSAELARIAPNAKSYVVCRRQLEALRARWTLVLRGLKLFYMSLGSFAAATLISLFGAVFAASGFHLPFPFIALLGLVSGTLGVAGLVFGCFVMVQETRLGLQDLEEEAGLTGQDGSISNPGKYRGSPMSPVRQLGDMLDKAFCVALRPTGGVASAERAMESAIERSGPDLSTESFLVETVRQPYANANGETNFRQQFQRSSARYR